MPKSLDPDAYPTLTHQILTAGCTQGYESQTIPRSVAEALRFDLYGLRTALVHRDSTLSLSPAHDYASVTISIIDQRTERKGRAGPDSPAILRINPNGSSWAHPEYLDAIRAGLPASDIPDESTFEHLIPPKK